MASAGTVTVDFAAETAKFTAEVKKVRSELESVSKYTGSVSTSVRGMISTFKGLVGVAAVLGTVRAVVQATAEAEAAQAQLNNALEASGAPVKAASANLSAYASQLQRTTTFNDEAIIQVETLLLSFQGLSGQTIKDATASVLDLSTRLGIDAPAAAKLLGKALSDPEKGITALTKAGVIFTKAQKEQIKTLAENGKLSEAQGIILAELERRFGGAAEAARSNFGGALTGLKNAFGDLLEGKGGINGATESINALTATLSSDQVTTAFGQLVGLLAKIIDYAAKAASGLRILFTGKGGNELVDLDTQITALQKRKQLLQSGLLELEGTSVEQVRKELEDVETQITRAQVRVKELRGDFDLLGPSNVSGSKSRGRVTPDGLNFVTGSEPTGPTDAELDAQKKAAEDFAKLQKALADDTLKMNVALYDDIAAASAADVERVGQQELQKQEMFRQTIFDRVAAEEESAEYRYRTELDLQSRILALRQGALTAGVGLLQALAQKSKTAAKALILVNRTISLAQAVQNTHAAATKALAIYGPTPAGWAAAAAAIAYGGLQVAAITATGTSDMSSVSAGQASSVVGPGTPNNPIYTQSGSEQTYGVTDRGSTQIIINQNGWISREMTDQLVDSLKEAINGQDVVIIDSNSRQAQNIRDV